MTGDGLLRLFLALPVDEGIRGELGRAVDELRRARCRVTWVRPGAMHLTVKFLGQVSADRVPELGRSLRPACAAARPVSLSLSGAGTFPPRGRPRVVWAGVVPCGEGLAALTEAVESACASCGFPRERRPFSPHLTLGRVRGELFLSELSAAVERLASRGFGTQVFRELHLFRSVLGPAGPEHTVLERFPLLGDRADA